MKVLHVEAGMHLYGGALQVVFLLRGLKARGIDSVLACPTGSAIATASTVPSAATWIGITNTSAGITTAPLQCFNEALAALATEP